MKRDAIQLPDDLSESRRSALLNLLADEDPSVYGAVREKIISFGPRALPWLKPHLLSPDPNLRRRAHEIVAHFGRLQADNELLAFCLKHGQDLDVEQGAWLLARTRYPDISTEGYRALLDSFAAALEQRLTSRLDAKSLLREINRFFVGVLGFSGNEDEYYDPDNSYLNKVIDRRTGNPITLSLVYLLLARRLRLPITGIGLPGHFLCRYQTSLAEIYVDVFNGGKLLAKADCVQYLLKGNYNVRDDYLSPVTPRRMLLRMCGNLHQIYVKSEDQAEATRLRRYLVSLSA